MTLRPVVDFPLPDSSTNPKVTPPAEIVRRWAIYAERQKNPGGSN